jgi:hypothetical protein
VRTGQVGTFRLTNPGGTSALDLQFWLNPDGTATVLDPTAIR